MLDSHSHLTDIQFKEDVSNVVTNFLNAGIDRVITVGCCPQSNNEVIKLANKHESIYCAVGVHPEECEKYNEQELENLLINRNNKLVAIGEIGLDYHYTKENKEKQIEVFISQIKLAKKYNLPMIIHCRDAFGDMLQILKEHAPFKAGAVMHCFSGSLEFAREILKLGVKISFTGTVTYKNAKNVQEVAKNIPLDSFFFETDCPYLSPQSVRGTRNEPKNVKEVYEFVAALCGIEIEEFKTIIDNNAKQFFGLN